MDYCEQLKRISDLYGEHQNDVLVLLTKLSDIGVIAGGSVVYALNDFVPEKSIGDVDVFFNDEDEFKLGLEIIHKTYPDCIFNVFGFSKFIDDEHHGINEEGPVTIVDVTIERNKKPSIQFILSIFEDPLDLIESFDLDYVQCAIYKNKFFTTERCKESHSQRKILKFSFLKDQRLFKALRKGFKTPLFLNIISTKKDPFFQLNNEGISYDELVKRKYTFFQKHPYIDTLSKKKWYFMDSIVATGVRITKNELCNEENEHNEGGTKDFDVKTKLSFKGEDGEVKNIYVDYFSYEVNVSKVHEGSNVIILKEDNFLRNNLVRQEDSNNSLEINDSGKYTILVKPYYKNLKNNELRGITNSWHNKKRNILPIPALCNYEVEGHTFPITDSEFTFKNLTIKSAKK